MSNSLQERYWNLIGRRSAWETKQRMYAQMRRDGLRRTNRPWPKAADSHFPLIDMQINQIKPFWMNQVFSGERLTDFVAMRQQLDDHTEAAADYFNFELKYNSQGQFRYRLEQAFDCMGLRGRSAFKITFNPRIRQLVYRAVNPMNILMDQGFDDFGDADDFVEIQTLTVDQYKREQKFKQDAATIAAIRGKADWILAAAKLDKQASEGVTHSNKPDRIILWNIYRQLPSGWAVETRSPSQWDVEICAPHYLATEWQGETLLPFYSLTMEIVDEGWYAPRGIGELCAQFEAWLCKCWNDRADAMTLTTRPIFTSDGEIPNIDNLRMMPGEIWPGNIKSVQMPAVSSSLMEEINFTRSVSEQRAKAPDFGQFAPDESSGGGGGSKPITATQSRISAGLQQVGADHDGETLRTVRMMPIYKHIWALKVQYHDANKAITYFIGKNLKQLPQQVVHDQYFVLPAGSGGTKHDKLQRALQRFTLLYGKPNVNNDELVTDLLAADDSRLVKRILLPSNVKAGNEAEAEAMEIGIMLMGFPAQVNADEDHALRIKVLVGFIQKQHITAQNVEPGVIQNLSGHLAEHMRILTEQQPQVAKQMQAEVSQMVQVMSQTQGRPALTDGTGTTTMPPSANGAPSPAAGGNGASAANQPHEADSISAKLTDLYPSERAQWLQRLGITAATPEEMLKTEQARAQLKQQQPTPEPKIASIVK